MQSGQHDYAQGSYPFGYTSGLPIPNNSGHDIKQPVAAGQPGMYSNSAAMQSAQQLHPTAMANQVSAPQGNVALSQQMSRAGPMPLAMQYTIRQPIPPRNVPNMTRGQFQGGQQTAQYGHNPVPVVSNTYMPATIVVNSQNFAYQQRHFPPAAANFMYPQNMYPINNCFAYSNPPPTSNGYYSAQSVTHHNTYGISPNMVQQQMPVQPAVQPQSQPPPRRKKNILQFFDPDTGKEVPLNSENESAASKTEKEPEPADSAICVQFATQVAATLNEPSDKVGKSVKSDEHCAEPSVVLCPNKTEPPFDTVMSKRMYDTEVRSVQHYVKAEDDLETELNINYDENCNAPSNDVPIATYNNKVVEHSNVNEQVFESKKCSAPLQEPCAVSETRDSQVSQTATDESRKTNVKESSLHIENEPAYHSNVVGKEKTFAPANLPAYTTSSETPQLHQVPEEALVSAAAMDMNEHVPVSVEAAAPDLQEAVFVANKLPEKENKKNKAKKKKDYNKRGESKEGGEMDAFLDKPEDASPVSPPVEPPPTASVHPPAPVTVTDRAILDKIPLPGEKPPMSVTAADRAILDTVPLSAVEPADKAEPAFVDTNSPPEPPVLSEKEVFKPETLPVEPVVEPKFSDVSPSEPAELIPDADSEMSPILESSEDKENEGQETRKSMNKYNYKEDQWAPFNPEGKKQYDRDFLLQFQQHQMSLCKPLNLPNLDVIKDKPNVHKLNEVNRLLPPMIQPVQMKRHDPFMPNYARSGPIGISHPVLNRRSQQGRRPEKPLKIISFGSSLTQSVKLHESENAWKPARAADLPADVPLEQVEKDKLKRSVQGVLNKLTPQKFETLLGQLKKLDIDTEDKLNVVIDLIFEKAIDEPNFSVPYASLCKHLARIRVPTAGQQNQGVNFRKLLLTKCQKEFEQDKRDQIDNEEKMKAIEEAVGDKKKELQLQFDAAEKKMRYRQLGNIRFIGELFKLEMLIEPIMHECIRKLLHQQSDEESLECLCKLLKTIGKELESGKTSGQKQSRDSTSAQMDYYFTQMQKIVDERSTSSRVRFMLQDVIELRKCKWVPRRDENNPKTIDQIHEDVQREAREQQQLIQNVPAYPRKMPDDRDKRKNAARNTAEEGWTPSKSSKNSFTPLDPKMLKLTKQDEVESMRLGPGGRGLSSWGRGSSGGTKAAESTAVQNRFSALTLNEMPAPDPRRESQRSAASSRESSRSRQMPPSVRKSASTSKDRENLLETVKGLVSGNQPKPQPQEVKKTPAAADVHLNGKDAETEELRLRGPNYYTDDEVSMKTKPLIDEFLHNNDAEEAIQCIMELCCAETVVFFISAAIHQVSERSNQARLALGQLLLSLVKKKIITLEHYKEGFVSVLDILEDIAIDVPHIYDYIGEILEPVAVDSELSFKFLRDVIKPIIPSMSAGLIMSAVLHCASKKEGTIKLSESWKSSGVTWAEILGKSIDENEFITKNKLSFILCTAKVKSENELSIEEISAKLSSLLQTAQNEEIYDWIDANVPHSSEPLFIRALVTEVHSHVIKKNKDSSYELDQIKLKNLTPVLTRYLQHNVNLELQALFAIQMLMNSLDHPIECLRKLQATKITLENQTVVRCDNVKQTNLLEQYENTVFGLLRQIFDMLYDDEVITEEAFRQWEQCEEPDEMEGKGIAVHSVKSFFTWLKESEDDE